MRKHIMTIMVAASLFTLAGARGASAQEATDRGGEAPGNIGVGVERSLSGLTAGAFVYDAGKFHIDALLAFVAGDAGGNNDFTVVGVGGRFFYHVAQSDRADFSIGGGLLLEIYNDDADNDDSNIYLEAGAKIRAFLVRNVAFTGQFGLVFDFDDDDKFLFANDVDVVFGGVAGTFGMIYFF